MIERDREISALYTPIYLSTCVHMYVRSAACAHVRFVYANPKYWPRPAGNLYRSLDLIAANRLLRTQTISIFSQMGIRKRIMTHYCFLRLVEILSGGRGKTWQIRVCAALNHPTGCGPAFSCRSLALTSVKMAAVRLIPSSLSLIVNSGSERETWTAGQNPARPLSLHVHEVGRCTFMYMKAQQTCFLVPACTCMERHLLRTCMHF